MFWLREEKSIYFIVNQNPIFRSSKKLYCTYLSKPLLQPICQVPLIRSLCSLGPHYKEAVAVLLAEREAWFHYFDQCSTSSNTLSLQGQRDENTDVIKMRIHVCI